MGLLLASYFGLGLIVLLSVAGPLMAGRWLADRDEQPEPDPELAAIEAHALLLLGASADEQPP